LQRREIFGHPVDFLHRVRLDQMVDRAGAELDRVVQVHAGHEEELPRLEADAGEGRRAGRSAAARPARLGTTSR
jgi:hypothetical protein